MIEMSTLPTSGSFFPASPRAIAASAPLAVGARRGIGDLAIVGIRLEHDALSARPLLQPVGAGADRVFHHPVRRILVGFDHLSRDCRELVRREPPLEAEVRPAEPDLQGEAVERAQPFEWCIVVPGAALPRGGERLVEADQVAFEHVEPIGAHLGIEDALEAVDVVLGGQLAPLALERRVGREESAGLHLDRVRAALIGDFRQRGRRIRDHPHGTREIVVDVQRIENAADHVERVQVVGGLRVEAVLGDRKGNAQRLRHVGRVR